MSVYDPARSARYYQENREAILIKQRIVRSVLPEVHKAVNRKHWLKQRDLLRAFADAAMAGGCVDCGIKTQIVLDFDHIRGEKTGDISQMIASAASVKRLLSELDKCEVRCANCHRIVTAQRRAPRKAA
jgi:hypothetical protein